jgi:hypothetical protein
MTDVEECLGFDSLELVDGNAEITQISKGRFVPDYIIFPEILTSFFDIEDIIIDGISHFEKPMAAIGLSRVTNLSAGECFTFKVMNKLMPSRFIASIVGK